MHILSAEIEKPDADGDVEIKMTLYICCPTHAAKVLQLLTCTLGDAFHDPFYLRTAAHEDILEEFNSALAEEMEQRSDPTRPN